jgi:hypothetical protein
MIAQLLYQNLYTKKSTALSAFPFIHKNQRSGANFFNSLTAQTVLFEY